jgi:cation diffusion facilitator family transporter
MSTVNHPKEKQKAALLSILSNSLMLIAKFTTGFYCNSIAIVSESIHSASDLLASIIASAAVRLSDHPPDDDHPFGHGKSGESSLLG